MAIAAHRRLTARYAMSNAAYGLTAVARPADKPAMRSGFWERANAHTTASEASITNVLIWPSRSSCSRYLARISVDSKGTSGPRTSGSKRSVSVSVPANAAMVDLEVIHPGPDAQCVGGNQDCGENGDDQEANGKRTHARDTAQQ